VGRGVGFSLMHCFHEKKITSPPNPNKGKQGGEKMMKGEKEKVSKKMKAVTEKKKTRDHEHKGIQTRFEDLIIL